MEKQRIIDIHTHVLPLVDDGSDSMERTISMLQVLKNEGVTDIFCTPHYRLDMFLTPAEEDLRVFNEVKSEVEKLGLDINLYLGQELHNAPEMLPLVKQGKAITIADSKYILLEFSWHNEGDFVSVVKEYVDSGYIPIVAHFERFNYYSLEMAKNLRNAGDKFQVNAFSFFGVEKVERQQNVFEMFENGLVDYIASDLHHWKKPYIKDCYALICEKYGKDKADKVFYQNALDIIGE